MLALTYSSAINAWTLYLACTQLGVDLRTVEQNPTLILPVAPPTSTAERLFFTEEASLRRALTGELTGRFLPNCFPLHLLDDKWAFAQWLASDIHGPQGLCQWSVSTLAVVDFPVMLKAKHSWIGGRKMPRGWVCHDADELNNRLAQLITQGFQLDWFFIQEWLGDVPMRLFSVCGFHDTDKTWRNQACVAERIANYNDTPSCSSVVVTVHDDWHLISQATHLLNRLNFVGPYEMEFIVTADRILVLELNPRFWMQHGLFIHAGNGLVKRYLDLDGPDDWAMKPPEKLLWIDGMWFLRRLVSLDIGFMRLLWKWIIEKNYRPILFPSLGVSMGGLIRILVSNIKLKLTGSR